MNNFFPTLVLAGAAILGVSGAAAQTPAGQGGAAGQNGAAGQSQQQGAQGANSAAGASSTAGSSSAQGNSSSAQSSRTSSDATSASTVSVTGCLAQGTGSDEFTISDASGKSYKLMSSGSVNLKPHVGHQVSITGSPMGADSSSSPGASTASPSSSAAASTPSQSGAATSQTASSGSADSHHLHVSDLKMISTTCSK